jgi:hypothetical protein
MFLPSISPYKEPDADLLAGKGIGCLGFAYSANITQPSRNLPSIPLIPSAASSIVAYAVNPYSLETLTVIALAWTT